MYVSMYVFCKSICTCALSGVGGGRSHWETWAPVGLLQTNWPLPPEQKQNPVRDHELSEEEDQRSAEG